jgi:predicted ATP-grasp superfamily ATP-dependent carboligase
MPLRILITDAQERCMLAVSRSLHAGGYMVSAAAHSHPAAAHWSRSCGERSHVPDPLRDTEDFVRGLHELLSHHEYAALLPGSDASLLAISSHRDTLGPSAQIGLPSHEVVERSLDKLVLVEEAAKAGLSCPKTVPCSGYEAAASVARELGFPIVLKPQRTVFHSNGAMHQESSVVVWSDEALARLITGYGDPCLVQQKQEGAVVSCSGVMGGDQLLAFVTSRYRRTWPPDGGNVAFSETIPPPADLKARIRSLMASIGWQGVFEVELVSRSDGTLSTIDLNPRAYGSLALAVGAGAALPVIWCDWLMDRKPSPTTATAGIKYRWEDADARHFWWQLRRRRFRAALSVLRPHRNVVHAYFRLGDPAPLVARILYMARRRTRHWRAKAGAHGAPPSPADRLVAPESASLPEPTEPRV